MPRFAFANTAATAGTTEGAATTGKLSGIGVPEPTASNGAADAGTVAAEASAAEVDAAPTTGTPVPPGKYADDVPTPADVPEGLCWLAGDTNSGTPVPPPDDDIVEDDGECGGDRGDEDVVVAADPGERAPGEEFLCQETAAAPKATAGSFWTRSAGAGL